MTSLGTPDGDENPVAQGQGAVDYEQRLTDFEQRLADFEQRLMAEAKASFDELEARYRADINEILAKREENQALQEEERALRDELEDLLRKKVSRLEAKLEAVSPGWGIPAEVEGPFREGLGHAAECRVSELRDVLDRLTEEQIVAVVGLCGAATVYLVIKALDFAWPTEQGLRWFAEKTAEGDTRYADLGVTPESVYDFLSQRLQGAKPAASDPLAFLAVPFLITVSAYGVFWPEGRSLADFIDEFEDAYEKAAMLNSDVLAALMVRARTPHVDQTPAG
jgi:hypothetical protein